jgi:GNAT superfamily N-acetyltransferase
MEYKIQPASNYPIPDLVHFLNQGFEGYFIPIQFNDITFLNLLRKDSVDLLTSRVLLVDGEPCGIALLARRGWTSRLAAMGIFSGRRSQGAGSWFMETLIGEARERGEREMVLEVIEQNETALRLYRRCGFEPVRRLLGFVRKAHPGDRQDELEEIDLRMLGRLISQYGFPDLPWQLSGESIAQLTPPARALRLGQAYAAISNPWAEQVVIWSVLVEPEARGQGLATRILERLLTSSPAARTWHAPAIFPEELQKVFHRAGFEQEKLSQWQMRLPL